MTERRRRHTLTALVVAAMACKPTPYREVEVSLDRSVSTASTAEGGVTPSPDAFRFSVAAMESPRDTYSGYSRLFTQLGVRLHRPIEFVQRKTYREINDLMIAGKLDAALVCTGGFLDLERRAPGAVEVAGVPVAQGKSTYHSLVIVARGSTARDLDDLAGKRFAYTDELSFSGRAYLVSELRHRGRDPDRFFSGTLLTFSHDRSIRAVADGLVDGAAVHSIIYDRLVAREPGLAGRTRVIHTSPEFGMMPVVVSTRLSPAMRERVREALLGLADDREGAEALHSIELERFTVPPKGLFRTAAMVTERAQ